MNTVALTSIYIVSVSLLFSLSLSLQANEKRLIESVWKRVRTLNDAKSAKTDPRPRACQAPVNLARRSALCTLQLRRIGRYTAARCASASTLVPAASATSQRRRDLGPGKLAGAIARADMMVIAYSFWIQSFVSLFSPLFSFTVNK